jgi:hypothetical protein
MPRNPSREKRPRRRTKGVPPLPLHLRIRRAEWFTADDVRRLSKIRDLPRMVADPQQVATELGNAIEAAAAEAGTAAATPELNELLRSLDDIAETADNLLAKLDLPPGLSGDPMTYSPSDATAWFARLARGVRGDNLERLFGVIASSPLWNIYLHNRRPSANIGRRRKQSRALMLQALKAAPLYIGLMGELAREARRLEAEFHADPPHGNTDVLRQVLFVRLRTVFQFAFGVPPAVFKDGERETPAIEWYVAILKHAAERRQQVTDDADMRALDPLAEFTWETVGTYMQVASKGRKR